MPMSTVTEQSTSQPNPLSRPSLRHDHSNTIGEFETKVHHTLYKLPIFNKGWWLSYTPILQGLIGNLMSFSVLYESLNLSSRFDEYKRKY